MAAINFDDYGDHDSRGTLTTMLNWGGAFLSIVLIAGLATWGWNLWVRDVTGIPVVRALEGPMRVASENPGGLASEYQGLTVNRIAEERAALAPSEQVVLAPAPATLDEGEDLAMAQLPAVPTEYTAAADIGEPERFDLAEDAGAFEAAELATVPDLTETDEVIAALEAEPGDVSPLPASIDGESEPVVTVVPTDQPSATDLAVAAALSDLGLKPEPAVVKIEAAARVPLATPRPLVRPASLQRVSLSEPVVTEDPAVADTIASGTRLVQLGAYASPEIAKIEWANMEAKFGDYMVGKEIVVQPAQTGGRSFFRLRAMGFDDLSDARRFCSVLVAEGANCIPVVHD